MAVTTHSADFTAPIVNAGPKTKAAAFYILIGFAAMAIAIPVALGTGDVGLFEECYSACAGAIQ